jgi:hypothetical protein
MLVAPAPKFARLVPAAIPVGTLVVACTASPRPTYCPTTRATWTVIASDAQNAGALQIPGWPPLDSPACGRGNTAGSCSATAQLKATFDVTGKAPPGESNQVTLSPVLYTLSSGETGACTDASASTYTDNLGSADGGISIDGRCDLALSQCSGPTLRGAFLRMSAGGIYGTQAVGSLMLAGGCCLNGSATSP